MISKNKRQASKETSITATYEVKGMTCDHCVNAVTAAIDELNGVTRVVVDLKSGNVTVTSKAALDVEAVRTAVETAGYELVS